MCIQYIYQRRKIIEIYQGGDFKHRTDGHGVCCGFYVAHLEFAEHGWQTKLFPEERERRRCVVRQPATQTINKANDVTLYTNYHYYHHCAK